MFKINKYQQLPSRATILLLLFFFLSIFKVLSQTANVTIEVTWPNFAEENAVQIRNTSNTTVLYQDCTANCFSGDGSNTSYTNTGSVTLPYGGYSLLLFDVFNDGWNGASSVRVFIDGVLEVDEDLANGESTKLVGFSVFDTSIPQNVPLTLFDQFNGYFDYALTGGTLRTNDDATDPCAVTTTSSNTLTTAITPGATIDRAYLFWAHSGFTSDEQVTFEGQTVNATVTKQYHSQQISFFGMLADVTTIIQGIANPSTNVYDFEDLTIDNDNIDSFFCGSTTLGGWALKIFYSDPSLPAVRINLYDGFSGEQNSFSDYTLDGFFAINTSGAKTSVLSWEGDDGISGGEELTLTTSVNTFELKGDGTNVGATDNPFNSTLFDNTAPTTINVTDNYGVDFDTYDISSFINIGETTATTRVTAGGDIVLLNTVVLKVPSNLITGFVFEDVNYPGGIGRDLTSSSGVGVVGAVVELYDSSSTLIDTVTTDINGEYVFAGMANGDYSVRVVSNTVRSSRNGGDSCTTCVPVQTFRKNYLGSDLIDQPNEIGGNDPSFANSETLGVLANATTVSTINIENEGIVGLDFGFNFNTIVNTNATGQGSLTQFIINSNELGETGLDIEAHPNDPSLNPAAGEDTTVFMIPPISDPLARTPPDSNFIANAYFDIFIPNRISNTPFDLPIITGNNTHIDGRSQTAYSGNTNNGTIGAGNTPVGTSANLLPDYELPEIQVHQNSGNVFVFQGTNNVIRNLSIYSNNNSAILANASGSVTILNNLIGVNALGNNSGDIRQAVTIADNTTASINSNYIATTTRNGVLINGGISTTIQNNHIINNGTSGSCFDNIRIQNGTGITIQNNLIEQASALGIDSDLSTGNITISENTIRQNGQNGANCVDTNSIENAGIRLIGNNSSISNNIINNNGGAGVILSGGNTSGNLISQNSIFANGNPDKALGIDLDGDGVTINDTSDSDNGPNELLNFPIFETATISGNILKVTGWSRPGTTLEIFLTDIQLGTATQGDNQLAGFTDDYGEGQLFLTAVTEGGPLDTDASVSNYIDADGNTDTTNRFDITVTLSTNLPVTGNLITATATLGNSTSEFSRKKVLAAASVITNRRITYRVKPN